MNRARRLERTKEIEPTDDGLLRRVSAGDEEAFTLLYRRKHPAIYRFALHMSGNAELAEDVTQEVFMALIRNPGRFDPSRGSVTSFLFGVARNHLRKRWEQDRRLVAFGEGGEEQGYRGIAGQSSSKGDGFQALGSGGNGTHREPIDEFVSLEAMTRLRLAISRLPENYREVVALCELEEMSYEEAAAALECPVGTVRSRLHRARTLLLEKLRGVQGETNRAEKASQGNRAAAVRE